MWCSPIFCESGGPFLSTVAIQLHDAPVSCRCSHFHMEVHFFFHPQNRTTPQETLKELAQHCDEFLVHAVDVEGKMSGIEEPLVEVLATSPIPVTCPRSCWTRDGLDPATEALDPSWRRLVEREVMLSKVKLKTYIRELWASSRFLYLSNLIDIFCNGEEWSGNVKICPEDTYIKHTLMIQAQ